MILHGLSLIAGHPGQTGGKTFHAANPSTSAQMEPVFHEASADEVAAALEASATAFADYRARSGTERAKFLEAIAAEIEALGDTLIHRAHAETGLPLARLLGERGRTCGQLRLFAHVAREGSWVDARIDPALPQRQPLPRADLRRMLVALGPVVVFGSSNFPLAFSVALSLAFTFSFTLPSGVMLPPRNPLEDFLLPKSPARPSLLPVVLPVRFPIHSTQ